MLTIKEVISRMCEPSFNVRELKEDEIVDISSTLFAAALAFDSIKDKAKREDYVTYKDIERQLTIKTGMVYGMMEMNKFLHNIKDKN